MDYCRLQQRVLILTGIRAAESFYKKINQEYREKHAVIRHNIPLIDSFIIGC